MPLLRFCRRSRVCANRTTDYWFSAARLPALFPWRDERDVRLTVPLSRTVLKFNESQATSSECLHFHRRRIHLSMPALPTRVPNPPRDITRPRLPIRDLTHVSLVPPSGVLNLSTVCSALELAGLFHPAATSRIPAVQGVPTSRSTSSSSEDVAPLPLSPLDSKNRSPWSVSWRLDFEALLHTKPLSAGR